MSSYCLTGNRLTYTTIPINIVTLAQITVFILNFSVIYVPCYVTKFVCNMANSTDSDKTAPLGAV